MSHLFGKSLAAAGLAALLAIPVLGPAQAAEGRNAAAAAGAIGGLAVGSALGSQSRSTTTGGGMVYEERGPADEECYVQRRRVWVEGYGWQMRRTQVCE